MQHSLRSCLGALLLLIASSSSVEAADQAMTVRVALLDMSSVMPAGMMGYGMMGQGQGMMGQGQGMMGPGTMGGMMSIRIDTTAIKAGTVAFDVTNWSRSILHEMLIVSVDNPSAPLPYDYTQAVMPEEQVKILGEVEDVAPNDSKTLELTLDAGSYLLICNLPGHFAAGMITPLVVTP